MSAEVFSSSSRHVNRWVVVGRHEEINLGDLRKLVVSCEGMPDESDVSMNTNLLEDAAAVRRVNVSHWEPLKEGR